MYTFHKFKKKDFLVSNLYSKSSWDNFREERCSLNAQYILSSNAGFANKLVMTFMHMRKGLLNKWIAD